MATVPEKITALKLKLDEALMGPDGELNRIRKQAEFLQKVQKGRGAARARGYATRDMKGLLVDQISEFLA